MAELDLIIRNATMIDGTGAPAQRADVGVRDGVIVATGELAGTTAERVIDAEGRIVAPGFVDQHTHYDAQIFWDPYCSNSGEHGSTTIVNTNCGFGIAPCRTSDRERIMSMLENTEEILVEHLRSALPWDWESWPELHQSMQRVPKGVNLTSYVPMNPLMVFVMGVDAAKSRRPNAEEIAEMQRLLGEALDLGAAGLSVSLMGTENTHRDFDGSPMPSDVMHVEDVIAICEPMRDRGRGVIQTISQIGPTGDRTRSEQIARGTGRPVLHNVFLVGPFGEDGYRDDIAWLDRCLGEGLDLWVHALLYPAWVESSLKEFNTAFGSQPEVNQLALCTTPEEVCDTVRTAGYREGFRSTYDPNRFAIPGGFDGLIVLANDERTAADKFVGRTLGDIARERDVHAVDALLDVILAAGGRLRYKTPPLIGSDLGLSVKYLQHPRVIAGGSDGGAHIKSVSMGCWTTYFLIEFVREQKVMSLEDMHHQLSFKPARALGLSDRGELAVGKVADLVVYDLDDLHFDATQYDHVYDMPNGDWRKLARAGGYSYIVVNGVVTHERDKPTGTTPGELIAPTSAGMTVAS
jgi:N-acyl-D-aspartate/D-glutamate deacylase